MDVNNCRWDKAIDNRVLASLFSLHSLILLCQLTYSNLQLNEVQNQGFTNQIILLPPASCILPPASKPVTLYLIQKKTAVCLIVAVVILQVGSP